MPLRVGRFLGPAMALFVPALAIAYGTRLHDLLPPNAVGALAAPGGGTVANGTVPGIGDADLASFRGWLYERARAIHDTAHRREFLARYPSASSFGAAAVKEFLMMDGAAHVLGVDSFAAVYRGMRPHDRPLDPHPDYVAGSPMPLALALELGSMYADLDRRNQSRLLRETSLVPARTVDGDSVPFDPMTLNMGRLTGLSSQAHAHYALNRHAKSADPGTLKTAPWDFAIATGFPGPVETYAADNAQLYSDLALLAALDGRPSGPALGAIYAGNAMHYMADAANAIHTVQVGIYPIFRDASVQYWLRRASRLFGLLGPTPGRNSIGIDIVGNLHTLSERLFEIEVVEALRAGAPGHPGPVRPSMRASLDALARGNDSLARALADTLGLLRRSSDEPDFGRTIVAVVAEAGNRDGAAVYRITRELAVSSLRTGRVAMDFDTLPEDQVWRWLRVARADPAHTALDDFNQAESRGLGRATAALRTWWKEYVREASVRPERRAALIDRVVTRLVTERLRYLEAAEERRRVWIDTHGGLAAR